MTNQAELTALGRVPDLVLAGSLRPMATYVREGGRIYEAAVALYALPGTI